MSRRPPQHLQEAIIEDGHIPRAAHDRLQAPVGLGFGRHHPAPDPAAPQRDPDHAPHRQFEPIRHGVGEAIIDRE